MKTTGAQQYEPGDITALPFDAPEDEARHIVRTCQALRGAAIREEGSERGISWSDMAILLRSVRRDGAAIMAAMDEADVPYVITGMDDLFQTDEAEAARQLFYFLANEIDETAVRAAWQRADLGIAPDAMDRAVAAALLARREMTQAEVGQFKVYNLQRQFVAFLENAGWQAIRARRAARFRSGVAPAMTPRRIETLPLFATAPMLGAYLLGPDRVQEFEQMVPILESRGMPKIDHLMGGRYTRAVIAWLDFQYGLDRSTAMPFAPDGVEDFTRCQLGSRRPA